MKNTNRVGLLLLFALVAVLTLSACGKKKNEPFTYQGPSEKKQEKVESKEKTQRFLGVPGVYEHPERMMALLFGFPTFEPAQADDVPLSGVFGYWMLELS